MKWNWRKSLLNLASGLPWGLLYMTSTALALLLYGVIRYRRKVVLKNLALAFPEMGEWERRKTARKFYRNLTDIAVETIKSWRLTKTEARNRISYEDDGLLNKLYEEGRGVMLVMGHFTNFEWTAMCLELFVPHPTYAVYHPIKNKRMNNYMVNVREKFGLKLFKMKDTYPFMLNQDTEKPLYIFMADQSPHKGKVKYAAPFFHPYTPVHLGVENLAKKCNLAVVFLITDRVGRGRYVMRAQLLTENARDTAKYEITRRHMSHLEREIRRSPESWMWSHKRWKNVALGEELMRKKNNNPSDGREPISP
ncbi:MAG: hypothetical protein GVY20_09290 [Bacteroidetes bacterium]|jgi:KDO2-lipid IV(A) lauroyltransferase|nr:hypothetical protein [Bacteroidota bacterium]